MQYDTEVTVKGNNSTVLMTQIQDTLCWRRGVVVSGVRQ